MFFLFAKSQFWQNLVQNWKRKTFRSQFCHCQSIYLFLGQNVPWFKLLEDRRQSRLDSFLSPFWVGLLILHFNIWGILMALSAGIILGKVLLHKVKGFFKNSNQIFLSSFADDRVEKRSRFFWYLIFIFEGFKCKSLISSLKLCHRLYDWFKFRKITFCLRHEWHNVYIACF